jgi:2-dehydropantoate 2-reductase
VLLSVKAHQTPGAADWLRALCAPGTRVLIVQNGIEHDLADPYLNGAESIPTVVYCGAELIEPGHIRHSSAGFLIVPDEPHGADLLDLFADSEAEVRPSSDFVTHQWRKLSLNVMANGLTALTGRTMSVVGDPVITPIAIELLRECWRVARAAGADLDPDTAHELVDGLVAAGTDGGTSMYYDTMAGRPTEHDAIHGAALRRAEALGIDTPTIRVIHALLDARSRT